ncbi:outer membrane channel protein [compost metagenome]
MVSTRQSVLGGERVNLDVLNAEQQVFSTRRDLAQARYDYLMAWTKLRYYAGVLGEADLAKVDEAFRSRTTTR